MKSQRLGRFCVDASIIDDIPLMRELMSRVIIVRAEMMFHRNAFEYIAISEEFEEVPKHCMVPEYRLRLERTSAGNMILQFEKSK